MGCPSFAWGATEGQELTRGVTATPEGIRRAAAGMSPPQLHPQVGGTGRSVRSSSGQFGKTMNRHRLPKRSQCLEHDFSFQLGWVWEGKSQNNNNKSSTTARSWQRAEREQGESKALLGSARSASDPASLFSLLHIRNELGSQKIAKINQKATH